MIPYHTTEMQILFQAQLSSVEISMFHLKSSFQLPPRLFWSLCYNYTAHPPTSESEVSFPRRRWRSSASAWVSACSLLKRWQAWGFSQRGGTIMSCPWPCAGLQALAIEHQVIWYGLKKVVLWDKTHIHSRPYMLLLRIHSAVGDGRLLEAAVWW